MKIKDMEFSIVIPTYGRFDVRLTRAAGEDRDLCARWRKQGYGLSYEPAAVVHHAHALTLPKFWRQHFHYGQAGFYFHQQRPRRVDMEPPAFYLRLLRYPFSHAPGVAAVWRRARAAFSLPRTSPYLLTGKVSVEALLD